MSVRRSFFLSFFLSFYLSFWKKVQCFLCLLLLIFFSIYARFRLLRTVSGFWSQQRVNPSSLSHEVPYSLSSTPLLRTNSLFLFRSFLFYYYTASVYNKEESKGVSICPSFSSSGSILPISLAAARSSSKSWHKK